MEEIGATVTWKLLATLEGGTILLAILGFLVHAIKGWITSKSAAVDQRKEHGSLRVIITNQLVDLRHRITDLLTAKGCTIVTNDAISAADDKFDVLIIIGSNTKKNGLDGLSELVSDDVFGNLKLLDSLIEKVRSRGRVVWVSCKGEAKSGAFSAATDAFDELVKTQLQQIALAASCEAVWVGRHKSPERAARKVVALLMPSARSTSQTIISIRTLAARITHNIWRWIKIT